MQRIIQEDIESICKEKLPWGKLRQRSVLITGANGFLGSYVVFALLECNKIYKTEITINALCRNREKAHSKFKEQWNNKHLHFIFQDVCEDIEDVYKSDIIIHAASPANPYIVQQKPYDVLKTNIIGYSKLLEKAKEWGTKEIIFFSSSAVYGYSTPEYGADESYRDCIDFTNYKDVYCLSKQVCEMMAVCYEKEHDVNIKSIRPFVVYGPGDDLTNNKAMIDFLKNCLNGENIVLKSKDNVVRTYIYISDAIRAFFYILLKGNKGAYNIASENNVYSISQIAGFFCECNENSTIEYRIADDEYLKNQSKIMIGKCERLRNLGWSEMFDIRDGIARMVIWGREMI